MADTLFADVSEFQVPVNDTYPHQFLSIRSNDGTYRDKHFAANLAWAKQACQRKKLTGFIVYFVWEPNWQETLQTLFEVVGTPHPAMAIMIDVESWGGRIAGDHSDAINASREKIIQWLGGNRARVIGYGNAGDLQSIWPDRKDAHIILANYGANPPFPGKIAHQFSDHYPTAPFGNCDINSADGMTPGQFAAVLGLHATQTARPVPPRQPQPAHEHPSGHGTPHELQPPHPAARPGPTYVVKAGDTLTSIAARYPSPSITADSIARLNHLANPNQIQVGQVLKIG